MSAHRCRHVRALDRLEADRPRAIRLAPGLGLLPVAIVDQHFSQRRRLARLLTALAREPGLIGIGVDEDTALVVEAGRGVEVVGHGTVTLVDASRERSNYGDVGAERPIRLLGVRLHLLPAGDAHAVSAVERGRTALPHASAPVDAMRDVLVRLVGP